ncbi:MAG: coat protein [Guiyang fiers-like virus 2]|nr:MAG: coat protein [Guiyang fiers-like virus 2]
MGNLTNVVLTDRKATPVAHTFAPEGISPSGVATLIETTGVPVGNSRLSISKNVTSGQSGRIKVVLKLAVPVVVNETINGVSSPKVVRTAYADVTLTYDQTSSEAERNDFVGMLESAFKPAATVINGTAVKLEGIW